MNLTFREALLTFIALCFGAAFLMGFLYLVMDLALKVEGP